jgi:hypothetical protein
MIILPANVWYKQGNFTKNVLNEDEITNMHAK